MPLKSSRKSMPLCLYKARITSEQSDPVWKSYLPAYSLRKSWMIIDLAVYSKYLLFYRHYRAAVLHFEDQLLTNAHELNSLGAYVNSTPIGPAMTYFLAILSLCLNSFLCSFILNIPMIPYISFLLGC